MAKGREREVERGAEKKEANKRTYLAIFPRMPKGHFLVRSNFVFISCFVKRDERIYALMSSSFRSVGEG